MKQQQLHRSELEKVITADGSTTLLHRSLQVSYRSLDGAKSESQHVFLQGTQLHQQQDCWKIIELGFGGGQNFVQTLAHAKQHNVFLHYESIDHAPIPASMAPEHEVIQEALQKTRETGQTAMVKRSGLCFVLHPHPWQSTQLTNQQFTAVFHDPFGPTVNPTCWTHACFQWYTEHISSTAIVATYGAAGHMRRAMRDAGFFVARAPGFGGKRECTLASLCEDRLQGHKIKYRPKTSPSEPQPKA